MRKDSLNRSILKLAVPNIISNITVPLLGFVDISIAYIGAIGLGGTIFSVMYSIFSFMRAGTTGFTAQAYGANDRTEMAYSLYRSLCIALIATILVLSLQGPVEWLSMKLLHGSKEVLAYTATYFRIRIWAAPAVLCLYAFNGWYIGMQNTTIPMIIAILTNVVNIVLSIVFVNFMGMGVTGVALGTVIAQYCGLLTAIIFLLVKFRYHLIPVRRVLLLQSDKLKRFFKVNADFMIRSILLVLSIASPTALPMRARPWWGVSQVRTTARNFARPSSCCSSGASSSPCLSRCFMPSSPIGSSASSATSRASSPWHSLTISTSLPSRSSPLLPSCGMASTSVPRRRVPSATPCSSRPSACSCPPPYY